MKTTATAAGFLVLCTPVFAGIFDRLDSREFKEYTVEMVFAMFDDETGAVRASGTYTGSRAKNGDYVHFTQEGKDIGKYEPVVELIELDRGRITVTDRLLKKAAFRKLSDGEKSIKKFLPSSCDDAMNIYGFAETCEPAEEVAGCKTLRLNLNREGRYVVWIAPDLDFTLLKEQSWNAKGILIHERKATRVFTQKLPPSYWVATQTSDEDLHGLMHDGVVARNPLETAKP